MRFAAALALATVLGTPLAASCADLGAKGRAPLATAPMKSNGAGVAVQYRVDGTPQAGAPGSVTLVFDGVSDPAGATVRLTTEGGLSLAGGDATHDLPPGRATTWTVGVVFGGGTGYLHVFTTQYGATSVTSVPVQVGKAEPPPSTGLKSTPSGDKILPMQVK